MNSSLTVALLRSDPRDLRLLSACSSHTWSMLSLPVSQVRSWMNLRIMRNMKMDRDLGGRFCGQGTKLTTVDLGLSCRRVAFFWSIYECWPGEQGERERERDENPPVTNSSIIKCTRIFIRTAVPDDPVGTFGYSFGFVQAYCSFRRLDHVPWSSQSSREGGQAALPHRSPQGRCRPFPRTYPFISLSLSFFFYSAFFLYPLRAVPSIYGWIEAYLFIFRFVLTTTFSLFSLRFRVFFLHISSWRGEINVLQNFKMRIEDPPRRKHMVFLGGAVLADIMKNKDSFWVTKQEWEEQGVRALDKLGVVQSN